MTYRLPKVGVTALAFACLAACGHNELDSRQLDFNQGLAYKHGSTEPFDGDAAYVDAIPADIAATWDKKVGAINGAPGHSALARCVVHFEKGLSAGPSRCYGSGNKLALELSRKDERLDGDMVIYNTQSGEKVESLHYEGGNLEGTVTRYTWDGKQMVWEAHFEHDVLNGRLRSWTPDGVALTDATWKEGNLRDGHYSDGVVSYDVRDGLKEGPFSDVDSHGKTVVKGAFKAGRKTGHWSYLDENANQVVATVVEPMSATLPDNFKLYGYFTRAEIDWNDDAIEGRIQGFIDGKLNFDFGIKNNVLDGPAKYVSNVKNLLVERDFDAGHPKGAETPTAQQPQATSAPTQETAPAEGVAKAPVEPNSTDAIIDAGGIDNLTVMSKNADGYPVFLIECNDAGQCVGAQGQPVGDLKTVAAIMPPVKPEDIAAHHYACKVICSDSEKNIIGRAP